MTAHSDRLPAVRAAPLPWQAFVQDAELWLLGRSGREDVVGADLPIA